MFSVTYSKLDQSQALCKKISFLQTILTYIRSVSNTHTSVSCVSHSYDDHSYGKPFQSYGMSYHVRAVSQYRMFPAHTIVILMETI